MNDEKTIETLPFTVRRVRSADDLGKALSVRHSAYARHLPAFAETLRAPEATDAKDGVLILLAECKSDGSPVGTMRIQTNRFGPLVLEQSVELPDWLKGHALAEATRLGVTNEQIGPMVKTALFKGFFQYCRQAGIEWMVIAGRRPMDRQYDRLLFDDVFPGRGYIPLRHASDIPHRIFSFNVVTAETRWARARHPLLGFMCNTHHPDIDVSAEGPSPRAYDREETTGRT